MQLVRRVVNIGNSLGVTFPREFVKKNRIKAGTSVIAKAFDGEIKFWVDKEAAQRQREATDVEVAEKFAELERRYGKLYDDLARIP
jgi:antitoxin component of MazEF toxin-antitoxin module